MSEIKITVVVPTCHRNDLLAKCLDCLAPGVQTLPADQYEVIVTDDGSRSTSKEMLHERYPWARWVAGKQKGPAANRNNGVAHARGEFVAFTDDDCLPPPRWLAAYLEAVTPDIKVYEGKTVCSAGRRSLFETAPINTTGGFLWSCNMMVNTDFFCTIGGFDERFPDAGGEDVEFRERIKNLGYTFQWVPEAFVDHPPRSRKFGRKSAVLQESQVRLWYAQGNQKPMGAQLPLLIAKNRLREVWRARFSLDSLRWLLVSIPEVLYVSSHMKRWDRKHRQQFQTQQASLKALRQHPEP